MLSLRKKAYLLYIPLLVLGFGAFAYATSFTVGVDQNNAKPMVIVDEDGNSINDANPLAVAAAASDPVEPPMPFVDRMTVDSAGSAQPFANTNEAYDLCVFQAMEGNQDVVVIGNSDVVAAEASRKGIVLAPLASVTLENIDLVYFWIDAEVNNDGVTMYCERQI